MEAVVHSTQPTPPRGSTARPSGLSCQVQGSFLDAAEPASRRPRLPVFGLGGGADAHFQQPSEHSRAPLEPPVVPAYTWANRPAQICLIGFVSLACRPIKNPPLVKTYYKLVYHKRRTASRYRFEIAYSLRRVSHRELWINM